MSRIIIPDRSYMISYWFPRFRDYERRTNLFGDGLSKFKCLSSVLVLFGQQNDAYSVCIDIALCMMTANNVHSEDIVHNDYSVYNVEIEWKPLNAPREMLIYIYI